MLLEHRALQLAVALFSATRTQISQLDGTSHEPVKFYSIN